MNFQLVINRRHTNSRHNSRSSRLVNTAHAAPSDSQGSISRRRSSRQQKTTPTTANSSKTSAATRLLDTCKMVSSSAVRATTAQRLIAITLLIATCNQLAEAKPLNQYQVRFRRLPPKEFSAALGSSITIECEAAASPPATIHWLKDGKRIQQNDFDENQLEDGQTPVAADDANRIALSATRSRLFIDCADSADEATYTCVAENAFSRISFPTKLNLIKPVRAVATTAADNELLAADGEPLSELASGAALKPIEGGSGGDQALAAVPQCLADRSTRTAEPVRIHMWTHNLVEVVKNNVVLYCRSSAKIRQLTSVTSPAASQQQSQDLDSTSSATARMSSGDKKVYVSWTLPDEKPVTAEQRDKYEILETGDLLIKDLRWADMGSYVCTVADEQSSDSVSAFVYPAAQKSGTSKRSAAQLAKKAALFHF